MPRIANETSALLSDVHGRLAQLVETARREGHEKALAGIRQLVGGGRVDAGVEWGNGIVPTGTVRRGPGRPRGSKNKPKSGDRRKNSWSGLSPEARLARVNAIRKGRGLPPRNE